MIAKTQWRVAIHNDRVNSFAVVVHLVHTLCAKTLEDAAQVATHAHHHGTAEVAAFRERDRAEQLVVALQRRGLNTTIPGLMGTQAAEAPDYFDATPVSDGIAVRMSQNVSLILSQLVGELIRFLETGELEPKNRGTDRWAFAPAVLLRHMFPDAFRDRAAAAAFRERHAVALRDSAAPRRVHARCTKGTEYVISHDEADDWLTTLGLARSLVLPRSAHSPCTTGTWITHMQERIATAVNPQLARYATNWAQHPQQDHRWDLLEKARPRLLAQLAEHHVTRIRYHAAFGTSDGISTWLCTDTDEQRDRLGTTDALLEDVRKIFGEVGFKPEELGELRTFVQSQETVDREYEGSWFLALR